MKSAPNQSKKARKRFYIESFAILLIICSPFIFKIHEYLPTGPDDTYSILGITIGPNGFADVSTHIWFLLGKIIPLYLLTIWFFTCRHWWYHIILIPLCMYAFQIFEVIYSEDKYVDTDNVLWLLPVCMVVIPFVYFVRVKLYDKHVHGIDLEAMDAELKYYKDKERDQLTKAGIKVDLEKFNEDESIEEDLSTKTPNQALGNIFSKLQESLRSLFSFFL
ncbi:MAG: hypothetical protein KJN76_14380 [Eudoraea sp.]|nr:hypothetical protein [Eudoraea sp.]